MSQQTDARTDPLGPFEAAVTVLSVLVALLVLSLVPLAVFGSGSFLGLGEKEACTVAAPGVVPYGERDLPGPAETPYVPGLRADARFSVDRLDVCDTAPSPMVKAAAATDPGADLLLLVGFLYLSRGLIRRARSVGLFTTSVAGRTTVLGWYLLVGALVVELVSAAGHGVVLSSAVRGVHWADGLLGFDVPFTLLVVALGIITVGRVLHQAVVLQDDVDATV